MEDVTDAAFRSVIAEYGKPDVFWTEFTSADGLMRAAEGGRKKLLKKLEFSEVEHPIVAQLFTHVPEYMEQAASLCEELGFDGIDINMGCPDKKVEKQGCGAALIKDPAHAQLLIRAAKRGASKTPISVKTRSGYKSDAEMSVWVSTLLSEEVAALTLHARTRKDLSLVPARWGLVRQAVELRNSLGVSTIIIGNGDVKDIPDARKKVEETGCDGVMLGRAIFGNPWLFAEYTPTPEERLSGLLRHLELFEELLPDTNYAVMKKHFKAYIHGWGHAKALRSLLMETKSLEEARRHLRAALK